MHSTYVHTHAHVHVHTHGRFPPPERAGGQAVHLAGFAVVRAGAQRLNCSEQVHRDSTVACRCTEEPMATAVGPLPDLTQHCCESFKLMCSRDHMVSREHTHSKSSRHTTLFVPKQAWDCCTMNSSHCLAAPGPCGAAGAAAPPSPVCPSTSYEQCASLYSKSSCEWHMKKPLPASPGGEPKGGRGCHRLCNLKQKTLVTCLVCAAAARSPPTCHTSRQQATCRMNLTSSLLPLGTPSSPPHLPITLCMLECTASQVRYFPCRSLPVCSTHRSSWAAPGRARRQPPLCLPPFPLFPLPPAPPHSPAC